VSPSEEAWAVPNTEQRDTEAGNSTTYISTHVSTRLLDSELPAAEAPTAATAPSDASQPVRPSDASPPATAQEGRSASPADPSACAPGPSDVTAQEGRAEEETAPSQEAGPQPPPASPPPSPPETSSTRAALQEVSSSGGDAQVVDYCMHPLVARSLWASHSHHPLPGPTVPCAPVLR
jgi:hypothetical protein